MRTPISARVDTPMRLLLSFSPTMTGANTVRAAELQAYLKRCCDEYKVSEQLQLNTTVTDVVFDETGNYHVHVQRGMALTTSLPHRL
jgi:cation diffusion facilitator CzcD-associated flavoprotein CzcO